MGQDIPICNINCSWKNTLYQSCVGILVRKGNVKNLNFVVFTLKCDQMLCQRFYPSSVNYLST